MSRHPPIDLTDREIADRVAGVMGWALVISSKLSRPWWMDGSEPVMQACDWDPCNNGGHAWMVLDRLVELGFEWDVEKDELAELPGMYVARVTTLELNPGADGTWTAYDDNPKHAVCLAALQAVNHE